MKKSILIIIFFIASLFSVGAFAQSADSLKTTTIKVNNLHCNNDMPTIKKQLQNHEGVEEITFTEIAGDQSIFTITYHSSATNQEEIEQVIESTPGCDDKASTPYKVVKKVSRKNRK
jgi:copper chaperone CopZ